MKKQKGSIITRNSVRLRAAVFIKRKKHILLINDPVYRGGCWILPGGSTELEENVIECAKREVFEETNLSIDIKGLFHIREIIEDDPDFPKQKENIRKTIELIFIGKYLSGEIDVHHDPSQKDDGIPRVKFAEWVNMNSLQQCYKNIPLYPYDLINKLILNKTKLVPIENLFLPLLDLRKG